MKFYYKEINHNARIDVKTFVPLIKAARNGVKVTSETPLVVEGLFYKLKLEPIIEIDGQERITLTLKWEDDKEQLSQTITIIKEESHLVAGTYVYYFLCGSEKCKKLFYIKNEFKSRKTFPHRYESQTQSPKQRYEARVRYPYRRYGKTRYKNKLTPYGKRCTQFEMNKLSSLTQLFNEVAEMEKGSMKQIKELIAKIKNVKKGK